MPQDATVPVPTSLATTGENETEVVAAITSGEAGPEQKLSFRADDAGFGVRRLILLLAGGIAVGYGAVRLIRARR
jgi:hypothetical protein